MIVLWRAILLSSVETCFPFHPISIKVTHNCCDLKGSTYGSRQDCLSAASAEDTSRRNMREGAEKQWRVTPPGTHRNGRKRKIESTTSIVPADWAVWTGINPKSYYCHIQPNSTQLDRYFHILITYIYLTPIYKGINSSTQFNRGFGIPVCRRIWYPLLKVAVPGLTGSEQW